MAAKSRSASFGELYHNYFAERSTIHGMRYVCMAKSFLGRRLIWTFAFLACFVCFCVNATQRLNFFLSYPINVNIQINYKDEMYFPAVTICNHNLFRVTKAAELGVYEALQHLLDPSIPASNQTWLRNLSTPYYEKLSHSKQDLIFNCQFGGEACHENDFRTVATDFGICQTFGGKKKQNMTTVQHSGACALPACSCKCLMSLKARLSYGLVVTVNVEQYEYMDGPEHTAGVKVLLHEKNEVPRVGDLGFSVPPSMHALVGIQYSKVENIPTLTTTCEQSERTSLNLFRSYTYSDTACRAECEAMFLIDECSCKPVDVPSSAPVTQQRPCNPFDERICLEPAKKRFRAIQANSSSSNCKCEPTCTTTSYTPSVSYASISQMNAQKILAQEPRKVDVIKERLLAAKENMSRLDASIVGHDNRVFNKLLALKRAMVDQEFYPDDELLQNLTHHLEPDCFVDIQSVVRERRLATNLAFQEIKAVGEQFTSSNTSLVLTSHTHFLWTLNLQLHHLIFYQIPDAMEQIRFDNSTTNGDFARDVRDVQREFAMLEKLVLELHRDLRRSADATNVKLVDHIFLFGNKEFSAYFRRLQNFSLEQADCLENLHNTMHRSFSVIVNSLQNFSKSFDSNCTQAVAAKEVDAVRAVRFQCQRGFTDNAHFDRGSMQDFISSVIEKDENEVRELFSKLDNLLNVEAPQNFGTKAALKAIGEMQNAIRKYRQGLSTKDELARNLTSEEAANHFALLTTYLSLVRAYVETKENAMVSYANSILSLDQQLPQMLVSFFATQPNNVKPLRQIAATSKPRVTACIAEIHNVCGKRAAKQSAFEQEMTRIIRELVNELRVFREQTNVDDKFVMRNFLQLSIFYRELREELITQQRAYNVFGLLCDIGGGLSLFIGASFISCFELLDTLLIGVVTFFQGADSADEEAAVAPGGQQLRNFTRNVIHNDIPHHNKVTNKNSNNYYNSANEYTHM